MATKKLALKHKIRRSNGLGAETAEDTPIIIDDGGSTTLKHVNGNLDKLLDDDQAHSVDKKLDSVDVIQVFKNQADGTANGVTVTHTMAVNIGTLFTISSKRQDIVVSIAPMTFFVKIALGDEGFDVETKRDTGRHYVIPNTGKIKAVTFQNTSTNPIPPPIQSGAKVLRTVVRLNFAT